MVWSGLLLLLLLLFLSDGGSRIQARNKSWARDGGRCQLTITLKVLLIFPTLGQRRRRLWLVLALLPTCGALCRLSARAGQQIETCPARNDSN